MLRERIERLNHSWCGARHRLNLGAGGGGRAAFLFDQEGHQLMRAVWGAEKSSAHTVQRTPLSKQRNRHLQTTLIEAAKMARRHGPDLAMLYAKERRKGKPATLTVARKLVAYLMAVDRSQRSFQAVEASNYTAAYLHL
jgi:transposase